MPEPQTNARGNPMLERILVYGEGGSGKTRTILSIAKWHQQRGSDAEFHVIDTDFAVDRMMGPNGDFADLENVEPYPVDTWPDYTEAIGSIRDAVDPKRGDWVGIDLVSMAWGAAQDEFARRVWGEDLSDYWVDVRAQDGEMSGSPIDGWDWGVINKMYKNAIDRFIMRAPTHVICTAEEKPLMEAAKSTGKGGESAESLAMFGRLGGKPAGQKQLAYRFHTVLKLSHSAKKGYVMTSAKDRERELHKGTEVGNFWHPYMVKTAGWKP